MNIQKIFTQILFEIKHPLSVKQMESEFSYERGRGLLGAEHSNHYVGNDNFNVIQKKYPQMQLEHPDIIQQHDQLVGLHNNTFTSEHKKAIMKYTSYTDVNKHLITDFQQKQGISKKKNWTMPNESIHEANTLDTLFGKHMALDHNVHAYSGVSFFNTGRNWDLNKHLIVNNIFQTPAFTSASLNPWVAHRISDAGPSSGPKKEPIRTMNHHILHFDLPKGFTNSAYIAGSANPGATIQRELLLARNQKFKLVEHHKLVSDWPHKFDQNEVIHRVVHVYHLTPHNE